MDSISQEKVHPEPGERHENSHTLAGSIMTLAKVKQNKIQINSPSTLTGMGIYGDTEIVLHDARMPNRHVTPNPNLTLDTEMLAPSARPSPILGYETVAKDKNLGDTSMRLVDYSNIEPQVVSIYEKMKIENVESENNLPQVFPPS